MKLNATMANCMAAYLSGYIGRRSLQGHIGSGADSPVSQLLQIAAGARGGTVSRRTANNKRPYCTDHHESAHQND